MLPISLSDPVHPQSGSKLMTKNYWAGMGALTVLQQKEEGWHTPPPPPRPIGGAGLQLCDAGPAALKILCWTPTSLHWGRFLNSQVKPFFCQYKSVPS